MLMLVMRDIRLRYKQSALGGFWAVARPLVLMVVLAYLFGGVANLSASGIPYPIFVFAALIAWDLFANVIQGCASSITSNKVLVEKLYCPRLLFPLIAVCVAMFDFSISLLVFAGLALFYQVYPPIEVCWLPLLVVAVVVVGLSVGLWLAAIAVWLRDVKFVTTYLIQTLLLLTPVGYGMAAVPEKFVFIVNLNPMATIVGAFRWALLGLPAPNTVFVSMSAAVTVLLLIGGLWFFNNLERSFADVI
ncbi:ABC transporter permease [Methylomonas koyamae]|nr:ABC transporter permease [Methylomonas koyamae]